MSDSLLNGWIVVKATTIPLKRFLTYFTLLWYSYIQQLFESKKKFPYFQGNFLMCIFCSMCLSVLLNFFNAIYCFLLFLQSGKSAAVYACAKEQGFNIVEVNLITNL